MLSNSVGNRWGEGRGWPRRGGAEATSLVSVGRRSVTFSASVSVSSAFLWGCGESPSSEGRRQRAGEEGKPQESY